MSMKKADHTRIPFEALVFALGMLLGVAVSVLGESRQIPPMGITQSVADGLYVNEAGDTMTGPLVCPDGTVSLPGLAFSDGTNADTGWYNTAAKGASIIRLAVNGVEKLNINDVDATLLIDLSVDGKTTLGDAVGDAIVVNAGTWTSQNPFTWNIDGDSTFAANGQTMTMNATLWDFTGATNVTVPDADAATEALNRQTGDARYLLNSDVKSGTVAGASFAGNPKIYTVTFNTAFPDTNYSVAVISEESRSWTFQSKLAGSFVMNSNANLALTLNVDWIATAHNDP